MALWPSAHSISITLAPCGAFTPTGVVFGSVGMVSRRAPVDAGPSTSIQGPQKQRAGPLAARPRPRQAPRLRMRRFRIALFILTSISHGVLALGLASALGYAGAPHAGWLALAASLALTAPIGGRLASARRDRPIPLWRIVLVEELYHAHWCAAAGACPAFLAAALGLAVHAIFAGPAGLGARLGAAALASYLCALLVALYAVFVRRRWVRVRTIDIPVAGLGAGFEGYRIAHLSDLHIGYLWPRPRAERWIARLRDIDADLVALTGDYVASSTAFHLDIAEVLGAMRGRDGAFAVMGNHDYF